ncbi:hypothetical protein PN836_011460 [Ningiella sp. W23]|uniref:hypothetical protein n=1 Tax=Ningiella sp. W23 TaxID=3023715 RepID=UPI0037584E0D
MRHIVVLCVCSSLLVLCIRAAYSANVTLYHSSPAFAEMVNTGELEGVSAKVALYVLEKVQVPYRINYVVNSRLNRLLDDATRPSCALFRLITPQRKETYLMSTPISVGVSLRVYSKILPGEYPDHIFNELGELKSLSALMLAFPNKKMIVLDHASYGELLNEQIAGLSEQQVLRLNAKDMHQVKMKLLLRDRADFAIMLPSEAFHNSSKEDFAMLHSFEIEGLSEARFSSINCNKHPLSYQFMSEFNRALADFYQTELWFDFHAEHWPQPYHDSLKQQLERVVQGK